MDLRSLQELLCLLSVWVQQRLRHQLHQLQTIFNLHQQFKILTSTNLHTNIANCSEQAREKSKSTSACEKFLQEYSKRLLLRASSSSCLGLGFECSADSVWNLQAAEKGFWAYFCFDLLYYITAVRLKTTHCACWQFRFCPHCHSGPVVPWSGPRLLCGLVQDTHISELQMIFSPTLDR